jgi:hypothetical protein
MELEIEMEVVAPSIVLTFALLVGHFVSVVGDRLARSRS